MTDVGLGTCDIEGCEEDACTHTRDVVEMRNDLTKQMDRQPAPMSRVRCTEHYVESATFTITEHPANCSGCGGLKHEGRVCWFCGKA